MLDHPFATPILIRGDKIFQLKRIEFGSDLFSERWLQEHLFSHPSLIPFEELEPAFKGSVAVAMEVGIRSGFIDLLCVSADGLLTVVETKLWRNPEARREVVSQLIHYAAELAKLDYGNLRDVIAAALDTSGDPLIESLRRAGHVVDEKRFHDAVSRNLRVGRFLLLAIGDGIQEGVESMADYLQGQPHLGFALRLVEMAVFEIDGGEGALLIQPRVVARTREVIRAVINFSGEHTIEVTAPPATEVAASSRSPITESEFYRKLGENASPEEVEFVRRILKDAPKHSLAIDWKQTGPLLKFIDEKRGTFFTVGGFTANTDFLHTERFFSRCEELGISESVWQSYFDKLVRLIPHSHRQRFYPKSGNDYEMVVTDENSEPLKSLMANEAEFWTAIDDAVRAVRLEKV